jgi:hypothetical protein
LTPEERLEELFGRPEISADEYDRRLAELRKPQGSREKRR